jgi:alcohol dehydrogenase (cytochrome c)
VVALDADTGALKWHFQFTPHDVYDYDSVQVPVLADIQWQGKPRKAMLFGKRNGFFYVLDRTNGQFLLGKPFTKVTWTSGLDAKGRPQNMVPLSEDGVLIYPGVQGGTNWYSPSFSPRTNLFYLPMWGDTYSTFTKRPVEYKEGQRFTGALPGVPVRMLTPGPSINRRRPEEGWGGIQAIDPNTGDKKWEYKMADVVDAGVLSTASDLIFTGGREGYALALDAKSGALLWKANVGGSVSNGPMTYMLGGRPYVAFAAGSSLFVYALRQP